MPAPPDEAPAVLGSREPPGGTDDLASGCEAPAARASSMGSIVSRSGSSYCASPARISVDEGIPSLPTTALVPCHSSLRNCATDVVATGPAACRPRSEMIKATLCMLQHAHCTQRQSYAPKTLVQDNTGLIRSRELRQNPHSRRPSPARRSAAGAIGADGPSTTIYGLADHQNAGLIMKQAVSMIPDRNPPDEAVA